jgi:alanine racemase
MPYDNPTTLDIDLNALKQNVHVIKKLYPHQKILAMVKANAYGHGLLQVANALKNIDGFGVARLAEANSLRQAGFKQKIVLMPGILHPDELAFCSENNIDLVFHSTWQIEALCQATLQNPINVWLKLETGMHRLGLSVSELDSVMPALNQSQNLKAPIVFMTHFSDSDNPDNPKTQAQHDAFYAAIKPYDAETSTTNSAAILQGLDSDSDWIRPGIMLYGASPFANDTGLDHDLEPVMTLKSRLIQIKTLNIGDEIGYGSDFTCPKIMTTGIVAIGYGDGYPRNISANTPVMIQGQRCQILGRVSMDMISVDVSAIENPKIGDAVILWGKSLAVETIAHCANTNAYELLTRMANRPSLKHYHG